MTRPEQRESPTLPPPFLVVGTTLFDVMASPVKPFGRSRCLPGQIDFGPGGSGRNIAENLARLGHPVELISAVGDDLAGRTLIEQTRRAGVGVSGVRVVPDLPTGSFVALLAEGRIDRAVVQGGIRAALDPAHVVPLCEFRLARIGAVILELALPIKTVQAVCRLAREARKPILLEGASSPNIARRLPHLNSASLVKGNRYELLRLTGVDSKAKEPEKEALRRLRAEKVPAALMTLGPGGCLLTTPEGGWWLQPEPVSPLATAGAGDAFLAGFLHGRHSGRSWLDALGCGHNAALLALGQPLSCAPGLTPEALDLPGPTWRVEPLKLEN